MWRDRTNLYISYRQSYSHPPSSRYAPHSRFTDPNTDLEEQGPLLGQHDDGESGTELSLLPPHYVDVKEEVAEHLSEVVRKSAKLDKLHQKHVLPGFDDEDVRREEEHEIERLTQEITKSFYECSRSIKKIENMVSSRGSNLTSAEREVAKSIQRSLAARVQESNAVFRKKQNAYMKKLGGFGITASGGERSSTPTLQQTQYATNQELLESEMDAASAADVLEQTGRGILKSPIPSFKKRDEEIAVIAKGITELATIFRDLQQMVVDQGAIVNRIDYTVETMAEDVQGADTELQTAQTYQRRTTKRRLILLLLLLIAAMIIFLIIRPKKDSSDGGSSPPPVEPPKTDPAVPPPAPPSAQPAPGNPPGVRDLPDLGMYQSQWRRRRRRRTRVVGDVRVQ